MMVEFCDESVVSVVDDVLKLVPVLLPQSMSINGTSPNAELSKNILSEKNM